jgi:pantoate--beta-alanine ligase
MQIITSIAEMQSRAESFRREGRTIGFVPTMGFLHEGHLSLMRRSRQDCAITVASIFVNPTQFGPREDLDRYPRDEAGDRAKCEGAGVDVLFMPRAGQMYPSTPDVFVTVEGLSSILEGAVRPGHFRGVATVVAKLFNLVKPHKAFFGQKDYQQCAVIRRMAQGLNMDVEIVVLPTVREEDGMAMSSRNSYLDPAERTVAATIHRALRAAEQLCRTGMRDPARLRDAALAVLGSERSLQVDYVEVADADSLETLSAARDRMVMLIAVRLGATRLIDNLLLP